MSKILHLKIKRILILVMLLLPMQHSFAQMAGPLHGKHGDVSSSHQGAAGMHGHDTDNDNACDTSATAAGCKTDHASSCSDNCSAMSHCQVFLVSTLDISPSRVTEIVPGSSDASTGITIPVETHPPQVLL